MKCAMAKFCILLFSVTRRVAYGTSLNISLEHASFLQMHAQNPPLSQGGEGLATRLLTMLEGLEQVEANQDKVLRRVEARQEAQEKWMRRMQSSVVPQTDSLQELKEGKQETRRAIQIARGLVEEEVQPYHAKKQDARVKEAFELCFSNTSSSILQRESVGLPRIGQDSCDPRSEVPVFQPASSTYLCCPFWDRKCAGCQDASGNKCNQCAGGFQKVGGHRENMPLNLSQLVRSCVPGQVQGGGTLGQSSDNSWPACAAFCWRRGAVAFDYTASSSHDACRCVEDGQTPRIGNPGHHQRSYCTLQFWNSFPQGCVPGRVQVGGTLGESDDNSWAACSSFCWRLGGAAFDYTQQKQTDACRCVEGGQSPRLGSPGFDHRLYCTFEPMRLVLAERTHAVTHTLTTAGAPESCEACLDTPGWIGAGRTVTYGDPFL